MASASAVRVTVDCGAGNHADGGGGASTFFTGSGGNASTNLAGTFPSNSAGTGVSNGSTNPEFWTAVFFAADPSNTVFALCRPD